MSDNAPSAAGSAPVTRVTLLQQPLPAGAAPTAHVEIRRITIAPSAVAGAHLHNGPVFGSIESGSAVFRIGDQPERVLRAGDVFYEPADTVISKFDATDEGVTFLGYFLLAAGAEPELTFP